MGVTAFDGPLIAFGQDPATGGLGNLQDSNPQLGPSAFIQGYALLDPRTPYAYIPGDGGYAGSVANAWLAGGFGYQVMDQTPSAASTVALAAAQVPVAGTPLVLAAGTGITAGVSITRADKGTLVTGLRAIDGAMGTVALGALNVWDPTKASARALQFTSVGNDSAATATIRGFDIYSYPMTEVVTLANAGVATGKKAFKYVLSITPAGTLSGANLSVGQSALVGLPLRVDFAAYLNLWIVATLQVTPTIVAAVTTNPATGITGDVRGTVSPGAGRLVMSIQPSVANIGSTAGLLGVNQFADF